MRVGKYVCVSMLLLVVAVSVLRAQGVGVKLSSDQTEPLLPADIRIQTAAPLGDRALVVWGTTAEAGGGDLSFLLYGQRIAGDTAVDAPVRISSTAAHPSTDLQVLALADRFLIIWRDLRSGSASHYAVTLDTAGRLGSEFLIDSTMAAPGSFVVLRAGTGYSLFWSDTLSTPKLYRRTLDAGGVPVGGRSVVGPGRVGGIIRTAGTDGPAILDRADQLPLLLGAEGKVIELSDRQKEKLVAPYFIGPDGTVVTITGTTAWFYRSLLDTAASGTRVIRIPDSTRWYGLFPSLDALGRLQISYGRYVSHGEGSENDKWVAVEEERVTFLDDSTFGPAEHLGLGYFIQLDHHYSDISGSITGVTLARSCRGRYDVDYSARITYLFSYQGEHTWSSVDLTTHVLYDASHSIVCGNLPSIVPGRLNDPRMSVVATSMGRRLIRSSAPAALKTINVPDLSPSVAMIGGTAIVSWLSLGADSSAITGRWSTRNQPVEITDMLSLTSAHDTITGDRKNLMGLARLADRSFVWQGLGRRGRSVDGDTVAANSLTMWAPTSSGWSAPVLNLSGMGEQPPELVYAGTELEGGTTLLLFSIPTARGSTYPELWSTVSLDRNGAVRWRRDSLPYKFAHFARVAQLDSDTYSIASPGIGATYRRGDSIADASIEPYTYTASYLHLVDGHLLRYGVFSFAPLELLDRHGKVLGTLGTNVVDGGAVDPIALQSPVDGSVILVYGAATGVRMIRLDPSLAVIERSHEIVKTPGPVHAFAATTHGDSLIVVWEDYRDTLHNPPIPDIYGTVVKLGSESSLGVRRDEGSAENFSITPNPISGDALLRLAAPLDRTEEVTLSDMTGRVVLRDLLEAGGSLQRLKTSTVAPGAYLLRLGTRRSRMVIVSR